MVPAAQNTKPMTLSIKFVTQKSVKFYIISTKYTKYTKNFSGTDRSI